MKDTSLQQNILIDVTRLFRGARYMRGTGRTVLAYWQYYSQKARAVIWFKNQFFIFSQAVSQQLLSLFSHPTLLNRSVIYFLVFKEILGRKAMVKSTQNALFFNVVGHTGIENVNYHLQLKKMQVRPIYMVQDLIPILYPTFCSVTAKERQSESIKLMLKHASALLCNSKATQAEFDHYVEQALKDYAIPPMISIHHGYSLPNFSADNLKSSLVKKPYFVVLGAIEPRKNQIFLIEIWQQLMECLQEACPFLIVIGRGKPKYLKMISNRVKQSEKLQHLIRFETKVSDKELVHWLKGTQALLFPSLAEGYGFPLIEALGLGVPVIASQLSVFQEIVGLIPEYLDPMDKEKWIQMIITYLNSHHEKRLAQLEKIKKFVVPSWEQHFNRLEQFIEKLE